MAGGFSMMPDPPKRRMAKAGPLTKRRRKIPVGLNLTSMVDMFTILVIFLLQTFSASGEIITLASDLTLPDAKYGKELKPAVKIAITLHSITVDNYDIGVSVPQILASKDILIPQLENVLKAIRERTEFIQQYSTSVKFEGKAIIQGDKKIPFDLLKKVMYTCGQVEYGEISLAVLQK